MGALLRRPEAAAKLGISLRSLDQLKAAGVIEYIQHRPGGRVLFPAEALDRYIQQGTHQGAEFKRRTYGKK